MTIKARLERVNVAEYTHQYTLVVQQEGGVERRIDLGRIKQGGMTLVNHEVSQQGRQRILSVFFYINILGHDLDQWLHFDLDTGARVEDYMNPLQAAHQRPERDRIETEADKKFVADKLKLIINKWGAEKDVRKTE
jgi:hypothetical protein